MRALAVLLLVLSLGSCASSYSSLRFAPAVQDVDLRADTGEVEARLVVAWRGIRSVEDGHELRFRVRVENPGFLPFTLVPAEFVLLDAALEAFGPARVELPTAVDAGGTQTFELVFSVPGASGLERFDLSALTLRLRFQGGRWSWSSTFQAAVLRPVGDPYWGFGLSLGASWSQ
ncbi:MAG: hypothetical protein EXS08_08805 [Planctomycetes bacterium]|nr:hypothetical protein [Planctomycetota bacterium]